jgi:hypothetical protein
MYLTDNNAGLYSLGLYFYTIKDRGGPEGVTPFSKKVTPLA